MYEGWIKLWRKSLLTSIYKDVNAFHLAMHLICKANIEDNKFTFIGEELIIKRGQLITGRYQLSEETGINPSTIRNKLALLKKMGFLDIKTTNKFSLITILNYTKYQNNEDSDLNIKLTSNRQQKDTIKEVKKEKKEKNSIYVQNFENLWNEYPRRDGKKEALRHFLTTVKTNEDYNNIQLALNNYKTYLKNNNIEDKYIKMGSTWFNNWQDWVDHEPTPKIDLSKYPESIRKKIEEKIKQGVL